MPKNSFWHYHKEVELICILRGEGTQFIGDNIKTFKSGDVFLIGSYLPHYWRFEPDSSNLTDISAIVIHFDEYFFGKDFLSLPENNPIKQLITVVAKKGLQMLPSMAKKLREKFSLLLKTEGPSRLCLLYEMLTEIAVECRYVSLSTVGFNLSLVDEHVQRINDVYEFSISNYCNKIRLEEVASVANMAPNSFCRYFKQKTGKTYSQFLKELRVGQVCRLLIETERPIKMICYECGFNNFTSFHKDFKEITGKSPLLYQKVHKTGA